MSQLRQLPFFGVIAEPQSHINIFYLLLAFPLGIAYFVFLVTGISVGASLLFWVGVPILALVLAGSWAMCEFEHILAVRLLKEDIPRTIALPPKAVTDDQNLSAVERLLIGTWRRFKSHVTNRLTWTGMLYLFLKFPLGIGSFVMVVVLVSVTGALLGAPFYYWVDDGIDFGIWQVDVVWEALILTLAGIPLVFVSLHLMNGAAFLSGRLARALLGPMGQSR